MAMTSAVVQEPVQDGGGQDLVLRGRVPHSAKLVMIVEPMSRLRQRRRPTPLLNVAAGVPQGVFSFLCKPCLKGHAGNNDDDR